MNTKIITLTGLGNVGSTILNILVHNIKEKTIINVLDPSFEVEGSFLDLAQAAMLNDQIELIWNDESLIHRSDYIFHTAGASVPQGKSRSAVATRSIEMVHEIFQPFRGKKQPLIIVISNPVEIVAYHIWKATGLPSERIISTGTLLDSIRLKYYLSQYFRVPSGSVETLVLGEHGEAMVPVLTQTHFSKENIKDKNIRLNLLFDAFMATRQAAQKIKATQGATMYGVAGCAYKIYEQLNSEEEVTLPLTVMLSEDNAELLGCRPIYFGLPCKIGKGKIEQQTLAGYSLTEWNSLKNAAQVIQNRTYNEYEFLKAG